jgi:hypothetical protein
MLKLTGLASQKKTDTAINLCHTIRYKHSHRPRYWCFCVNMDAYLTALTARVIWRRKWQRNGSFLTRAISARWPDGFKKCGYTNSQIILWWSINNYDPSLLWCCAMSIGKQLHKFWRGVLFLSSEDNALLGLRESENAGSTVFWKVGKI